MAVLEAEGGGVADRDRVGGEVGVLREADRGIVAQGDVLVVSTQIGVDREGSVVSCRDGIVTSGSGSREREIERVTSHQTDIISRVGIRDGDLRSGPERKDGTVETIVAAGIECGESTSSDRVTDARIVPGEGEAEAVISSDAGIRARSGPSVAEGRRVSDRDRIICSCIEAGDVDSGSSAGRDRVEMGQGIPRGGESERVARADREAVVAGGDGLAGTSEDRTDARGGGGGIKGDGRGAGECQRLDVADIREG